MKPKAFVMENPHYQVSGAGNYQFWLTVPKHMYELVRAFDCVSGVIYEDIWRRAIVIIDPRYDYEEAWLWIYEQLEAETREVELGEVWDTA